MRVNWRPDSLPPSELFRTLRWAGVFRIEGTRLDVLGGLYQHGPYTGNRQDALRIFCHHYVAVNHHLKKLAKLGLVKRRHVVAQDHKGGRSYTSELTPSGHLVIKFIQTVIESA